MSSFKNSAGEAPSRAVSLNPPAAASTQISCALGAVIFFSCSIRMRWSHNDPPRSLAPS